MRSAFARLVALNLLWTVFLVFHSLSARAEDVVVGMNVVSPLHADIDRQNALLSQLKATGVRVIRIGATDDAASLDFLQRASEKGIAALLILDLRYPPDAPTRAYRPKEFPEMWSGHPLSWADPELSRAWFQSLLTRIDRKGIKLAGLELGNEINGSAFNQDFPLYGENKAFGLQDLERDPEARQVARGFDRYVRVIAALKEVRDHLEVNRTTPILSAGMVDYTEDYAPPRNGADVVYLSAAISYLRAHGLDEFVDGYGVHVYLSSEEPENPAAKARRLAHLDKYDLASCRAPGQSGGKPCWITEWGFRNADLTCPPDERRRSALIRQMREGFRAAAGRKVLAGLFYYDWEGDPWFKDVDPYSVFRCNALTLGGQLANAPLSTE